MACNGKTDECRRVSDIQPSCLGERPGIEEVVRAILSIHGLGGAGCSECYDKHNGRRRTAKWELKERQARRPDLAIAACDECRGNRPAVSEDSRAPYLRVLERFLGQVS